VAEQVVEQVGLGQVIELFGRAIHHVTGSGGWRGGRRRQFRQQPSTPTISQPVRAQHRVQVVEPRMRPAHAHRLLGNQELVAGTTYQQLLLTGIQRRPTSWSVAV